MKRILIKIFISIGIITVVSFIYLMLTFNHFSSISKGKPIPGYKNERSALLVIDIQEGTTGSTKTWLPCDSDS